MEERAPTTVFWSDQRENAFQMDHTYCFEGSSTASVVVVAAAVVVDALGGFGKTAERNVRKIDFNRSQILPKPRPPFLFPGGASAMTWSRFGTVGGEQIHLKPKAGMGLPRERRRRVGQ